MRLELLGTGGFHPSEERHTSCYFLPEQGILLDAGTAAFRVPNLIQTPTLDVLLTHAHLDHIIGLTYLLGLEHEGKPVEVRVHAEEKVIEAVQNSLFSKSFFPIQTVSEFIALSDDFELNGVRVRSMPLVHPGGSVGLRFDSDQKSMAYVTDTERLEASALQLIQGVDLLLHESYFTDDQIEMAKLTGHSTSAQAAQIAAGQEVGKLVLIHQNPRTAGLSIEAFEEKLLTEAKQHFADVTLARDKTTILV